MQEHEAIRTMAAAAGYSLAALSREAGRCDNYVANAINRGSSLTLATAATLAAAAGYSLAFIPSTKVPRDAIVIDSPRPLAPVE